MLLWRVLGGYFEPGKVGGELSAALAEDVYDGIDIFIIGALFQAVHLPIEPKKRGTAGDHAQAGTRAKEIQIGDVGVLERLRGRARQNDIDDGRRERLHPDQRELLQTEAFAHKLHAGIICGIAYEGEK